MSCNKIGGEVQNIFRIHNYIEKHGRKSIDVQHTFLQVRHSVSSLLLFLNSDIMIGFLMSPHLLVAACNFKRTKFHLSMEGVYMTNCTRNFETSRLDARVDPREGCDRSSPKKRTSVTLKILKIKEKK